MGGEEVRTRLHNVPVCEGCRRGDHEDCIETLIEVDAIAANFMCGCMDEFHFEDSLGEADAEW
jgi:hypothetical protein